jgi:hypothetical protein
MQRSFELKLKTIDETTGEFTGIASTYGGDPDSYLDIVDEGAFAITLSASKTRPLLWQHREPIGTVALQDTKQGLIANGKLALGVQRASEALALLRAGAVQGLSIGFETVKSSYVGDVRHLEEVKLWEVSLTPFPANSNAIVTSVKALRPADILNYKNSITQSVNEIRAILKGTK